VSCVGPVQPGRNRSGFRAREGSLSRTDATARAYLYPRRCNWADAAGAGPWDRRSATSSPMRWRPRISGSVVSCRR